MIELLGESQGAFAASVVLTYEFDLALYDGLIRRTLSRSGIRNQLVFCDFRTYAQDVTVEHGARFIGRHYSVTPVYQARGAFHPKVYLLLGERRGRLLIGSGNATVGGLMRNTEVFGSFEFEDDDTSGPHEAFAAIATFVDELVRQSPDPVKRQWEVARKRAAWLTRPAAQDGRHLLLGGPGRRPLLDQVRERLPSARADEITVCSASFDRRLRGLRRLYDMANASLTCILQPSRVTLDGREVQHLEERVRWREFRDPYPPTGATRDVRAHAKLMVFAHGAEEICVFGSANASEPALDGLNTEVTVMLPSAARGSVAERLHLDVSVDGPSIANQLGDLTWPEGEDDPIEGLPCLLTGCVPVADGFRLLVAEAREVPPGSQLAIIGAQGGPASDAPSVVLDEEGWVAPVSGALSSGARFVWLQKQSGERISNAVAVTYPETVPARRTSGVVGDIADAMLSLPDGQVLGTVLFELLNSVPDFEMHRTGSASGAAERAAPDQNEGGQQRVASFFYTDAPAARGKSVQWRGDQIDLDILSSLIQPLTSSGSPLVEDTESDDLVEEEQEQREIEQKGDRADGSERQEREGPTAEQLQRAAQRVERRLDRAAAALEAALDRLPDALEIPPQSVARQIWMAQIGAFLAGRTMTASDGQTVLALSPLVFAEYLLRVCRAMVGSRRGGFLDRLQPQFWQTEEGATLCRGLGLLRTAVVWATEHVMDAPTEGSGRRRPKSVALSCPELVAARFVAKANRLGVSADRANLERRFPALDRADRGLLDKAERRILALAAVVDAEETAAVSVPMASPTALRGLAPGTLVIGAKLGVTVLDRVEADDRCWVVDLSKTRGALTKYHGAFRPVTVDGAVMQVTYRL